ncbi:IS481 family transposase [Microlunatus sp. Gsoil 973]|uniref:IS481 family transposase n=1 Tax=Microlunatus sp. Gsoil 973 TaxID=2672569 RepID=UPI0012B4C19F|nr:IS481 family transposase [Microlunatus sp. Gsoil 973]QGN34461.1 IS481 family transposase [Microlunatus sp. Gsoil 973]QGN34922.1 IS481 family transposase [Microlunatus sp. Gsoil 973]
MSHRNARLNVRGRKLLVERVCDQGWKVAHAAKAQGVSRQCASRWVGRYRAEGEAGLEDRSSRPHHCPNRTPVAVENKIIELRRSQRRGQDWIGPELGVPARTVCRVLRRRQIPYLADCDPLTGEVIRASKTTTTRYERDRPGELVHMDVKKIGKIPDGGGWKAHGRQMGSTAAAKKARIGYDYVHSLVDDHSRLAYSEILDDEKGPTCASFLARAAQYFADHGIDRIERVITDNHWSYRRSADLAAVITTIGAKHKFIKPHCPWQNGKVERFNRTLAIEWAYHQVFTSNAERAAALAPWLNLYNTRRRHTALGGLPPISRL